jgi:hypothetical protein
VDAGQVAGILVLVGVVGILAAIAGSGIAAGPVKFPEIPRARQIPVALASAAAAAAGVAWWAVQQHGTSNAAQTGPVAAAAADTAKLRVVLVPTKQLVRAGESLRIESSVSDANGSTGTGQCALTWRDVVGNRSITRKTHCDATFVEPDALPGTHHIHVTAEGTADVHGTGSAALDVTVG